MASSKHIVVIGAGFAGFWSAMAAHRVIMSNRDKHNGNIEITLVAPDSSLVIRPRLYESNPAGMSHSFASLFKEAGINFLPGTVDAIHTEKQAVDIKLGSDSRQLLCYDRLILATGSSLNRPSTIPGLKELAFDIDSIEAATKLEVHLSELGGLPKSRARDTIIVCGAGFTGIELATELVSRLRTKLNSPFRIILVENADSVGPQLGSGPRPVIERALADLGITVKLGSAVKTIAKDGITLTSGERIECLTTIWTAGIRASELTAQIDGEKDSFARLYVDEYLRVPSTDKIFATGDTACALADAKNHYALMSCQHALVLGRFSGYNAAADLLQVPMLPYSQAAYNCCLDLGPYGAVITGGWERKVWITGEQAKRVKTYINRSLIYPPQNLEEAVQAAHPIGLDSDELFRQMAEQVKL